MPELPNIVVSTPTWLALLTTGVGACQGAAIGRSRRGVTTDLVGTFVFALLLGLGGGFARDIMIGNTPLAALRSPWYVVTVVGCVGVMLLLGRHIPVTGTAFTLLDALTLGLYAAIGTQYALDFGVSVVGAALVGLFASLTGGVVVALLNGDVPSLLVPGLPYGLLALGGIVVYLALSPVNGALASVACICLVVAGRFATRHWRLRTPTVPALPDNTT